MTVKENTQESDGYKRAKERAREANRADHLGSTLEIEEVVVLPEEDARDIIRPTDEDNSSADTGPGERPKAA